jgi:autotransporter translocation and assembly factor TamB
MPLSEPEAPDTSTQRPRRWLRRAGMGVVVLVGLIAALVGLLQLPPVATAVVRKLLTLAPLNPGNRLEVGRVSGNFLVGLTLDDVRLRQAGRELARIRRLRVAYRLPRLRPPASRIDELDVEGAEIGARRQAQSWDLLAVLRKSADTAGSGEIAITRLRLRDARLAAELSPDSVVRARNFDLVAHDLVLGRTTLVAIDSLGVLVQPPASDRWYVITTRGAVTAEEIRFDPFRIHTELSNLSGRAVVPRSFDDARLVDRLDVRLVGRPLDLADVAPLAPSVPSHGQLQLDGTAKGDGDLVTAHLAATLDQATLALDGGTRIVRGRAASYRAHGVIHHLDPSRLNRSAPAGSVNAELDADLDAPAAQANGSARVRLEHSRIGATLLRRLDLQALITRGAADFTLVGALDTGTVNVNGRARPFDSIPTYRFSGTALRMPGTAAVARGLAGQAGNPVLLLGFRIAGQGKSPDSARVDGRVRLTAVRDSGDRVELGHANLRLAGGRLDLRPELLAGGGTISAVGRVTLGDTMSYALRQGRIDRVDLGRLSGDTLSAPLSGRFSLAGRGTTPTQAKAEARLHFDELRYGERRVDGLDAVARLDRGRLRLQVEAMLQGGRLTLEGLGRPFDSTATYVLRSAALERADLGTFLGRPDLAGPVTLRLTGQGRWRKDHPTVQAKLTVDSSRLGRVAVSGGAANVRLTGQRLAYDAALRTSGGALSLAGDGTPTATTPSYRVRQGRLTAIDLGTLLDRPDLRTDLNSSFTAELTGRSADSLRATLEMVLLPSRVNQAELTDGSLEARVQGRSVDAKLRAGGQDAVLDAALSGTGAEGRSSMKAEGTLRVEHLARWTGRHAADGRVESRFALQTEADSVGLRTVGGTVDAMGGVGGVKVPAFHLAMSPAEGQVHIDTLQLRSNAGVLDGSGRIALRAGADTGTLKLLGRLGDLGPVAALAGADTVDFDSARVNLAVTGPAWHWRLEGGADAHGLAFAGNLANRLTLTAAATVDSTRMSAVTGGLTLKDAVYGTVQVRALTASGRYDSTLALDAAVNVGDSLRAATKLRGTVSGDTVRAALQQLTLEEGGRTWALERPAGLGFGPRIEVAGFALRAGQRSITVDGRFDRHGSSDITLRIAGLDLETLRAAGLAPMGGQLDGHLHLTGRAATPRVDGTVGLAILTKGGRRVGVVATDLDWTDRGLKLRATATPTSGGGLTVDGTLPYRLTLTPRDTATSVGFERNEADTVALAVRADSFNLALFQPLLPPEAATGLHGLLQVDARVGGSIHAPAATGTLSLTRAALELPTIKVAYQKGEVAGRLQGETLTIDRLRLLTGKKQELAATGAIRLRPLSEPGLDLNATLEHFRLVNSAQLQTAASGRVRLEGTLLHPILGGTLRLDRTNFFVGAQAAQAKVEQVELTPEELRRLARDFGPSVLTRGKETPGLMDRAKLDLAIQMPRQVWIRRTSSPKTDIELAGQLRVRQEPGQEMQFFGHVEPVPGRGTLELNGKQFRLTEGDINLAGPVDSTKLDVNASYQVPTQSGGDNEGVLINVNAKGRLDSLGLTFTADPSMSQDDILSYIVTGRPASDNPLFERESGGGGGGGAGQQVAMGTLTSAISNAAGKGLGFDVFQIRQEATRGLTLTAGRYLGSRLFLDLELPLQVGSRTQQATSSNLGPGFQLEYTLRRWLRANLQGGSLSPGLLFKTRHAY